MYAVVDILGSQFKLSKDAAVFTPRLSGEEGDKVEFDKVLLVDDKGKIEIGNPTLKGAKVSVKILEQVKGDKVVVFKKKRRKGYRVKRGHRQDYTKILVENIKK